MLVLDWMTQQSAILSVTQSLTSHTTILSFIYKQQNNPFMFHPVYSQYSFANILKDDGMILNVGFQRFCQSGNINFARMLCRMLVSSFNFLRYYKCVFLNHFWTIRWRARDQGKTAQPNLGSVTLSTYFFHTKLLERRERKCWGKCKIYLLSSENLEMKKFSFCRE